MSEDFIYENTLQAASFRFWGKKGFGDGIEGFMTVGIVSHIRF